MASVYGYIIMIVGLSVLLGMAGVSTAGGQVLAKFSPGSYNMTTGSYTSDFTALNALQNNWWEAFGILLVFGSALTIRVAFATRDLGQAFKSGLAGSLCGLCLMDLASFVTYALSLGTLGQWVSLVAGIIYIPLIVGFIVAVVNWVGGSQ